MAFKSGTPLTPTTFSLMMIGIALNVLGMSLHGTLRGLTQGAGVLTIVIAVALISAQMSKPKQDGMWLPSRDEDEQ